jgi:hypothetical protein
MSDLRASVCGRFTYEAAEHWGDENPFGVPVFIVTHQLTWAPRTASGWARAR